MASASERPGVPRFLRSSSSSDSGRPSSHSRTRYGAQAWVGVTSAPYAMQRTMDREACERT